jgi:acyl carrier protein
MNELLETLKQILEVDEIPSDSRLKDYEFWDSLSALTLIAAIEENYGIFVEAEQLLEFETVQALIVFVETTQK